MKKSLEDKVVWVDGKCDKYDYLIAAFCGLVGGAIDSLFVGMPGNSRIGNWTNKETDRFVVIFAKKMGWKPNGESNNEIANAIQFFENKYKVGYDQNMSLSGMNILGMTPTNHHFKSLSHAPDIIGLIFSIIDQFMSTSHFLDAGRLIVIDTATNELHGVNFIAKLFSGFANWLGHLISDIAGSSGGRRNNPQNYGSGISVPFFELFQSCNFGKFGLESSNSEVTEITLADLSVKAFENGYDLRFGTAMTIPVLLMDVSIRLIWSVKHHFYQQYNWSDCIPTNKHADLRCMLLVGNAALCLVDVIDATIRSKGNPLQFILHLNFVAWLKLIILIFKELCIQYNFTYEDIKTEYQKINVELDAYLLRLKSVDYESYKQELCEVQNINKLLVTDSNEAIEALYSILEKQEEGMQFCNFEEFDAKLQDKSFVLKI